MMSTNIIIPAMASSDYPMSEHSDPFTVDIVSNSFPLSTENEVSEEVDPFEHLELSLWVYTGCCLSLVAIGVA
jgi:hypothetical protein